MGNLGPVRVGARAGLGPSPGWGPVRVGAHMGPYGPLWAHIWAHMGPYGPIWAHMGPYGSSWTGLGKSVNFPSTFRKTIWTNFACFGSKTEFLMKFLDDSAWFCVEELKKHVVFQSKTICSLKTNLDPTYPEKILGFCSLIGSL